MSALIIGLTGGIGSGKTTVTNIFTDLGIDIIDADVVAREVVAPGTIALNAIKNHFGNEYLDDQQQLDRTKLRSRVFSFPEDKTWLNNLLHPLIREQLIRQTSQAKSHYCILSAPLLLENNLHKLVDRVLVVDVTESLQISRTIARDPSSEAEVKRIIESQISRQKRISLADDIIDNQSTDITKLTERVMALNTHYLTLAKKKSKF